MNLTHHPDQRFEYSLAKYDESVVFCCRFAKEMEDAGNYEAARSSLGGLWQRVGERPKIEDLSRRAAAEVLLRTGVLTGYIGSAKQIGNAQETAKNLISESIAIFEELGATEKIAEGRIELAVCYWREGALDEARVVLQTALAEINEEPSELRALALLHSAKVEATSTRFTRAYRILTDAAPLFDSGVNDSLKGRFHGEFALVLRNLGDAERREDYTDRALVEYAAAIFHFEKAGHMRYCARVENNLGFLFFTLGKFVEAHEHLDRARQLFASFKDEGSMAQVDETRARVLLAQGCYSEAEKVVSSALNTLKKGGEQSLLAEVLITFGRILARLNRHEQSRSTFERAAEVARQAGAIESAGQAWLAVIEELGDRYTPDELRSCYERADELLEQSEHQGLLGSLRRCARRVFAAHHRVEEFEPTVFIHASPQSAALLREARSIAHAEGTILFTGETGTGKEVLARLTHGWSGRTGRFVTLNCAALNDTLFESQLFGHRKGSFTDAVEDYAGAARIAAGGTLFLDEIAELSYSNQGKLLRLIEHGEIHPLGAVVPEHLDVRIFAATNSNLKELVVAGRFREDLYYRLEAFHLTVPPLRERPDDIPPIAIHFINDASKRYHKRVTFTTAAIEAMRALPLRGNTRELRSLIERTMLTAADGVVITPEMVETVALRQTQQVSLADPWAGFSLKNEVQRLEQRFIELALKESNGMVSRAARLLGFKHHESLNSLLKTRFQNLLEARAPVTTRRRSIMRVDDR